MRVGLDVSAAFAGDSGIKFYIEETLAALSRVGRGHEFVLYTSFWRDPGRLAGLRLPKAPNFTTVFKRFPQRWLLPLEERLPFRIQERWFRPLGLDVFHGLGNIVPPLDSIPSVLTVHHLGGALETRDRWSVFYFETLTERSVRRAGAVIAVSEFSRREVIRQYGVPEGKVHAILEGGPAEVFRAPPADVPAPGSRPLKEFLGGRASAQSDPLPQEAAPYVLYVGAIFERKNLGILARAFAKVRAARSAPLKLVLAGRKGSYYPALAAAIRELGIEKDVLFLGGLAQADLVQLYQNAAVFAFPSLVEGFGFPVLEAMRCGAPVVASRSGAVPEVAGDAAALVDADDAAGWSAALAKVLGDPAWSAELRRRGLRRAAEFSWNKSAEGTLAVYARLRKDDKIRM